MVALLDVLLLTPCLTPTNEVKFTDGSREKYQANLIANNMYAQVDDDGNQFQILEEIVDHHKDNSTVPISEGMIQSANGNEKPKNTTRG